MATLSVGRVSPASQMGIIESPLAERLGLKIVDKTYARKFARHLWLSSSIMVLGLCGAVVSYMQLRVGTLSAQSTQFWLLCLVLGVGLLCIAIVIVAGSLVTHFAMLRVGILRREMEIGEVLVEQEIMLAQIRALTELYEDAERKQTERKLEAEAVLGTIKYIAKYPDASSFAPIADKWRKLGADDAKLLQLESPAVDLER